WGPVLAVAAALATIGTGALLGRVLTSADWMLAITMVGLGVIILTIFANPPAGFLLWIFFSPYTEGLAPHHPAWQRHPRSESESHRHPGFAAGALCATVAGNRSRAQESIMRCRASPGWIWPW
ncbi:MAG: hypothetical protein AB2L09_13475, partial [Coriobacteriia bacterium]